MEITSREQTTAEYFLRYMVENNSKRKFFCKEKYICIPTKVALEIADAIEKSREKVSVVRCKDCKHNKREFNFCLITEDTTFDEHFCSYGERIET